MKIKIITVATVILLLVVMSVPVYAETTLPAPPTDACEYWVYAIDNDGPVIYLITGHNPITVRDENGKEIVTGEGGKSYYYGNNKWVFHVEVCDSIYNGSFAIVAANHDIEYEDGSGFFFECPKVSPLIQTMEGTDFGAILRTFSVGLIPIIGCLVLVISLRKGWEFLRTQLTH